MAKKRAVVCVSGGLDSCVTLAEAVQTLQPGTLSGGDVCALHMSYGQHTQQREHQAFLEICDHYDIERRLHVPQPALGEIGGSALTDPSIEVPSQEPGEGVPVTYVPFRNGQILAVACAWAETLGATQVYLGAVQEDSSGYPDCRDSFFRAFERAVAEGTRPETQIEIVTPLLHLTKGQIVKRGVELKAPFPLTWSCYTGLTQACGVCESCRLRLKGFAEAGIEDRIPYAATS